MNYYSTLRFWIWNLLQELQIWCKSEHIKKGTLKRILRVRPVTTKKIFSVKKVGIEYCQKSSSEKTTEMKEEKSLKLGQIWRDWIKLIYLDN